MDKLLGTVFVGGGYLLPYALLRYSTRHFGSAAVAATIVFWMSFALFAAEVAALAVNFEEHGAPLAGPWFPPSPELAGLAYPPFALATAFLLRREARRRIEREDDERWSRLADSLEA